MATPVSNADQLTPNLTSTMEQEEITLNVSIKFNKNPTMEETPNRTRLSNPIPNYPENDLDNLRTDVSGLVGISDQPRKQGHRHTLQKPKFIEYIQLKYVDADLGVISMEEGYLDRLAPDAVNVATPIETKQGARIHLEQPTEFNFLRCVKANSHRLNWSTVGNSPKLDTVTGQSASPLSSSSNSSSSSSSDLEPGSILNASACADRMNVLSTILQLDEEENIFSLASMCSDCAKLTSSVKQPMEWTRAHDDVEEAIFPQTPTVQVCCHQRCCMKSKSDLPCSLKPCCRVPISGPPCVCGKCAPCPPCKVPCTEVASDVATANEEEGGTITISKEGPSPCIPPGPCQPSPPCQPCGPCVGLKITKMQPIPPPCYDRTILPTCTCASNKPFKQCSRRPTMPCNPRPPCFQSPPPPPPPCCSSPCGPPCGGPCGPSPCGKPCGPSPCGPCGKPCGPSPCGKPCGPSPCGKPCGPSPCGKPCGPSPCSLPCGSPCGPSPCGPSPCPPPACSK